MAVSVRAPLRVTFATGNKNKVKEVESILRGDSRVYCRRLVHSRANRESEGRKVIFATGETGENKKENLSNALPEWSAVRYRESRARLG